MGRAHVGQRLVIRLVSRGRGIGNRGIRIDIRPGTEGFGLDEGPVDVAVGGVGIVARGYRLGIVGAVIDPIGFPGRQNVDVLGPLGRMQRRSRIIGAQAVGAPLQIELRGGIIHGRDVHAGAARRHFHGGRRGDVKGDVEELGQAAQPVAVAVVIRIHGVDVLRHQPLVLGPGMEPHGRAVRADVHREVQVVPIGHRGGGHQAHPQEFRVAGADGVFRQRERTPG